MKKIILIFFLVSSVFAQEYSSLNYSGFGLDVGESGAGLSYNRTWFKDKKLSFVGEIRLYDAKHPDEIIMQDYFLHHLLLFLVHHFQITLMILFFVLLKPRMGHKKQP